ncbi:hypothetical protein LOD99_2731 [Oopsacas minuta]|uniref:Uncharacterized protein n=1 Tax=Oopsacas minuta TaxID=111878 RepID=A0AAV7K127_9METZ|nr:hypothetical protein LOD99_2731 [Oopsacas minuta]
MSRSDLSNGLLTGLPPDLQTKLLKKIAQLTKVIYTLHTKSEDQDQITDALRIKYEEDLTKSSQEYEIRVEQFHTKYLREIEKYRGQLKQADIKLKEMNESLKSVENKSETQKSYYINELSLLDKKYTNELDKLLDSVTKNNSRAASVKEIEDQNRERVKLLEEAHQTEIDRIVSKFVDENKLLRKEIDSLQSEQAIENRERESLIETHREQMERLVSEQDKALTDAREEAQSTVDHLLEDMKEKYVKERGVLHSQISSMQSKISSIEQDNQNLNIRSGQLEDKLHGASTESEELQNEFRKLSQEKISIEEELNLKNRELVALMKRYETVQTLETDRITKIGELEIKLSALGSTMSALESERDALFTSLSEARKDSEKHLNRFKQNDRATEGRIKCLEQECGKLKQQITVQDEEMESERGKSRLTLEQQKVLLENKMEEEHKRAMKNAEKNTQAALIQLHQDLTNTHQFEVEKLSSEKDENIRSLEESVEALVRAVNDKTREIDSLTVRLKEGESGAVNAAEQVGALQNKLKQVSLEMRDKHDTEIQLNIDKIALERMCEEIQLEARKREQELIANSKTETNTYISELNQKWESKNEEELTNLENILRQAHTTELSRYKLEFEEKLRLELDRVESEWGDRDNQREQELVRIERDLLAAQEEKHKLQAAVDEKERMLLCEKKEREQNSSISKEEVERIKEQYSTEVEAVKQAMSMRSAAEMSDLRSQYEKELAGVRAGHNASVNALKDSLNREKLGVLREIETRHRTEIEAIRSNNLQSIEQIQRSNEEEKKNKLSKLEAEFKLVLEEKDGSVSELKRELREMSNQIITQDSSSLEYKEDISRLHNAIRDMGVSLEQKESELLAARRNSSQQLKQRDLEIRTIHQKDVKILEERYQIRAKQLAGDFTLIRRGLEGKIEELNEELEQADKRYFSREPRSEDLILISELQRSVNLREAELDKMREEMKFYKLELINREQSYNKLFGTKPKIGLVTTAGQTKSKPTEGGVSCNSYPSAPTLTSQRSRVLTTSREGETVKPAKAEHKSKTPTPSQARLQHIT